VKVVSGLASRDVVSFSNFESSAVVGCCNAATFLVWSFLRRPERARVLKIKYLQAALLE
jgi:hypothetical protein